MRKLERKKLQAVIERIAFEKMSVATACEGLCAPSAFFRYMTEDKELEEQYTRARESRADARFESVDAVLANLHAGKIDAHTARVMIDTIKWQCGKERPKRYSDRLELTGAAGDALKTRHEIVFVKPQPLETELA